MTTSQKFTPCAVFYVPENEAEGYRKAGLSVVAVPDSVRGITATRNWILDNTAEARVVMVDDDANAVGWVEFDGVKGYHRKMSQDELLAEFGKCFDVTEDLHYRIWGCATHSSPRAVYPYRPFLWRSYVTASCIGIRNDTGVRFDPAFPVKEDYELTLRCVKEDGGVVAARYFYWQNPHWRGDGGCKDYRTQDIEARAIAELIKRYPGMIRQVTRGGAEFSVNLDF